jgi:transcriptional regulator with XRE-family HTH domain
MPKMTINEFDKERQIIPETFLELEKERDEIFKHNFSNPTVYRRKMFSESLSYLLKARNLKGTELSVITQVPEPMISDYIRGRYAPRGKTLFKICNFLKVNPDWMIGIPGSKIDDEIHTILQWPPDKVLNINEFAMSIVKTLNQPLKDTHIYIELLEKILILNTDALTKVNEYASDLSKIKSYRN